MMLMALYAIPAMSQLNGDGFYRVRNAQYSTQYISLTNDKFNYKTCVDDACGGLRQAIGSAGQARAMECVGQYLATDIHMIEDPDCIFPADVIYAFKIDDNPNNSEYNLIGQGTSLESLTTGTYPHSSTPLQFKERYINIKKSSGSGANTLYTASIELTSATYVFLIGYPSLGTRYFVDNNGAFGLSETNSATNAKWYVDQIDHFNVLPEVEYMGKFYTTIKVPFAFKLSNNVLNAYTITGVEADGTLQYEIIATNGQSVPAGTPVILECASANATDCWLVPQGVPVYPTPNVSLTNAPAADESSTYTGVNLLGGTYFCTQDGQLPYTHYNSSTGVTDTHYLNGDKFTSTDSKYVIGITESGKLGFVPAADKFTAMPANKAWLTSAGEFPWAPEETHIKGDVNHDGYVTIADVTILISYVLGCGNGACPICADFNEDGEALINDVTSLISYVLHKSPSEQ